MDLNINLTETGVHFLNIGIIFYSGPESLGD